MTETAVNIIDRVSLVANQEAVPFDKARQHPDPRTARVSYQASVLPHVASAAPDSYPQHPVEQPLIKFHGQHHRALPFVQSRVADQ